MTQYRTGTPADTTTKFVSSVLWLPQCGNSIYSRSLTDTLERMTLAVAVHLKRVFKLSVLLFRNGRRHSS